MKLSLTIVALALAVPYATYAQNSTVASNGEYSNTFSSGATNVSQFSNHQSKRFNDWSISVGAGVPLLQSADLTSIKNGNGTNLFGYSTYLSIDKAITHAFGINLQYDRGETRQGWFNTKNVAPNEYSVAARTQYDAIAILGDINFSNMFRRIDNHSPYRWALHGYAGIGTIAYRAYQKIGNNKQFLMTEIKPFQLGSMFFQTGAGLKFKVNRSIDIEGRLMYVVTGDDEFDGGGDANSPINKRSEQVSDNFFNATLGLSVNLGKHKSHLMWHDPLQEIYHKLDTLASKNQDIKICKKGDADNDGVCDDWDRQLDTPEGARVDGAGIALDTDLDGVIDLYDKCVTVPGPAENEGCPVETSGPVISVVVESKTKLEEIEFDLNSDKILPSNTPILNNAINYINSSKNSYNIIGATDTRGTDAYNQKLSEKRANNVKNYLIKNGVWPGKLQVIGKGKTDLKYPECKPATKCPEWKNRANRRVYFEAK